MGWQQTFLFPPPPSVAPPLPSPPALPSPSPLPSPPAVTPADDSRSAGDASLQSIERLRALVSGLETAARRERLQQVSADAAEIYSTGGAALDRLLPQGGIRPGTLVQWVDTRQGGGAALLALTAAASILRHPAAAARPLAVIDLPHGPDSGRQRDERFYPPAAIALGIPADSLLVVRPQPGQTAADRLWALAQTLRSGAVAAVYAPLASQLDPVAARRLQLAAEAGGTVGLLVQRRLAAEQRRDASFTDIRWRVTSLPSASGARAGGRRLRVQLERCRGGSGGASCVVVVGVSLNQATAAIDDRCTAAVTIDAVSDHSISADPISTDPLVANRLVANHLARKPPTGKPMTGEPSHATSPLASDLAGRLACPASAPKSPAPTVSDSGDSGDSGDRRHSVARPRRWAG